MCNQGEMHFRLQTTESLSAALFPLERKGNIHIMQAHQENPDNA
jgi:hypothetical protein